MRQPKQPLPDGVWSLARRQGGVVCLGQLTDLGVTRRALRRALDDRTLWRVANGVYSTSPETTWLGYAHAGVLLAGTGAVLSGRAAGYLLGLCPAPATIDVSAPRRVRDRGPWRFHEVQLQGRGDPPRTSPERTLLDMARHLAPDRLLHLLADAITAGKTTAARVLESSSHHRTFRNRALVVEVLSDVAAGVMSALERRFRDDVQRAHGLPVPTRQVELADGHITDVVHEEPMLVVELDGRLGHEGSGVGRTTDSTTATPDMDGPPSGTAGTTSSLDPEPSPWKSPGCSAPEAGRARHPAARAAADPGNG